MVAIDAKREARAGEPSALMEWRGVERRAGASTRTAAGAPRAATRSRGPARSETLGAGEILLTSMDRDGTGAGYDLELTRAVSEAVGIPVIASGGAGTLAHLADGVTEGKADAVLVASIFHFGQHTVGEAKRYLRERGVPVRIDT